MYLQVCTIILTLSLITIVIITIITPNESFKFTSNDLIPIENPYNKKDKILWLPETHPFIQKNFPGVFHFDLDIKSDIIKQALEFPKNSCVIDCGAHIGDGSIPIAHALMKNKRSDVTVYALDPSKHKCEYMETIKKANDIKNLVILNAGLSDKQQDLYISKENANNAGENTGGWGWSEQKQKKNDIKDSSYFVTLDSLVENKTIKQPIAYIHLDVEGMELQALKGGLETLKRYKPYLSIEEHDVNNKDILKFLSSINYKFDKRLEPNNLYSIK